MPLVTELREAVQYDGTNAAALVNTFLDGSYTVISDNGSVLVIEDGEGSRKTLPLNQWLVRDGNRTLVWHGNQAAYEVRWAVLS